MVLSVLLDWRSQMARDRSGVFHTTKSADEYQVGRAKLIAAMGGKCNYCKCHSLLEFHHTNGGRTWVARKKSRWQRLALYRREYLAGKLVLACRKCNSKL